MHTHTQPHVVSSYAVNKTSSTTYYTHTDTPNKFVNMEHNISKPDQLIYYFTLYS
jgi:hypothetical protein